MRLLLLLMAMVVVACANGAAGDGTSGVRGIVLIGPQCPVQTQGQPCPDVPFASEVRVLDRDGDEVARAPTGADGRFELALAPGEYTVEAALEEGGPPSAVPQWVTVGAGMFVDVELAVDSGIR
jgi:hypothetical protein